MSRDLRDITEVGKSDENDDWKEIFSLECQKLNAMKTFREATESECKLGLFHFCPLCFSLEEKYDGCYETRYTEGGSSVEHALPGARAISAQGATIKSLILAPNCQKNELIIAGV